MMVSGVLRGQQIRREGRCSSPQGAGLPHSPGSPTNSLRQSACWSRATLKQWALTTEIHKSHRVSVSCQHPERARESWDFVSRKTTPRDSRWVYKHKSDAQNKLWGGSETEGALGVWHERWQRKHQVTSLPPSVDVPFHPSVHANIGRNAQLNSRQTLYAVLQDMTRLSWNQGLRHRNYLQRKITSVLHSISLMTKHCCTLMQGLSSRRRRVAEIKLI